MKFLCPITSLKFVGTISLGLLTGISYSSSTIHLPSLTSLPSASYASQTLQQLQTTTTKRILTLASVSSISLLTAYTLASPRGKHPYLLWTALVSFLGGQGVEFYYNGLERFYLLGGKKALQASDRTGDDNNGASSSSYHSSSVKYVNGKMTESEFVDIDGSGSEISQREVNGEKVEMEMERERKLQWVRTIVSGIGFTMGVVGVWGDGA